MPLPVRCRSSLATTTLPDRALKVEGLQIDRSNVAQYAAVTGLRYGDEVPLTYPFALTFPVVMSLVTGFDFPFAAMGSVHTENALPNTARSRSPTPWTSRYTPRTCVSTGAACWSTCSPTFNVGNDLAWQQVTTFLHQQRTSLSDEPKPPKKKQPKLPPPTGVLTISAGQIRRYASVGGDHNPSTPTRSPPSSSVSRP